MDMQRLDSVERMMFCRVSLKDKKSIEELRQQLDIDSVAHD